MQRYKLTIEYDGTPFCGWQRQTNGISVQQTLEEAIVAFAGHEVKLSCAGRTDAGVHALHQVAHVDLEKHLPTDVVRDASNAYLRSRKGLMSISVLNVEQAADTFDARHSAIRRYYLYRILNRRAPSALDIRRVWHIPKGIDVQAMQAACEVLVGHHDFTTFRAAQCQAKSPMKTLESLVIMQSGDELYVRTYARSFLHHQVRSMVGALVAIGAGRWNGDDLRNALLKPDRTCCPAMAPAHGLYLAGVDYN
jgi:tRNA pseudouridine38-40 synthase